MSPRGAYFISSTDGLRPVPEARSPWAADMLHGRLLAGLAARAVEGTGHDTALRVVRLTVDMFRTPPMSALHVTTRVIRDGRRVRVVDVSLRSAEVEVARACALLLRTGAHPGGATWRAPEWDVPHPDTLPSPGDANTFGGWDIRLLTPGGFWTAERKRLWARDRWQLVAGEEPSPVVRAALAADLPKSLGQLERRGLAVHQCRSHVVARPASGLGMDRARGRRPSGSRRHRRRHLHLARHLRRDRLVVGLRHYEHCDAQRVIKGVPIAQVS